MKQVAPGTNQTNILSCRSNISHMEWHQPLSFGRKSIFNKISKFARECMEMKDVGPKKGTLLDPPMILASNFVLTKAVADPGTGWPSILKNREMTSIREYNRQWPNKMELCFFLLRNRKKSPPNLKF